MSAKPFRFFSRAWPWERVIDIGSGDNPHPRADVLIDAYATDLHRWGPLRNPDRLLLIDARALPFGNREFDVALCAHCLEHCEDPEAVVREMTRVGRRGILEVPTPYLDVWFQPFNGHRWIFAARAGILLYAPSPGYSLPLGTAPITVGLLRHNPLFRVAYLLEEKALRLRLHWSGSLQMERVTPEIVLAAQAIPDTPISVASLVAKALARLLAEFFDRTVGAMRRAWA